MRKLVIIAAGDNVRLHHEALAAAVEAVRAVNHAPVYRAWVEEAPSDLPDDQTPANVRRLVDEA